MLPAHLVITDDGSHSLRDTRTGETYHSTHGAVQESRHIFIERGLLYTPHTRLNLFEVGFGTGLNAFLSWIEAEQRGIDICYTTVELYPVASSEWELLNFTSVIDNRPETTPPGIPDYPPVSDRVSFGQLHTCTWGTFHQLSPHFSFRKLQVDFTTYTPDMQYDLIYFDAFSPEKQPELWLPGRFTTLAGHCNSGAILTTYCAKGIVKQALRDAGFTVERLQGPPGKRHMLRARL
jgi:tRNA U34 5-methylaminomethyl-2-thiouridine-forming methyltransferase MnmC